MTSDWWSLRKGPALIYIEYGHTNADLHATDFRLHKGPPVTVELDLEHNLRTRHKGVGTYVDAQALADGDIRRLTSLKLDDTHVLTGLRHHLKHTADTKPPWRLVIMLRGRHEFTVRPEYRDRELVLRCIDVVDDKKGDR